MTLEEIINSADYHKLAEEAEKEAGSGFLTDPHDTLYPPLWSGLKLKPAAKVKLEKYLNDALEEAGYADTGNWLKYTIFGSGASYNWDEDGDLDIHIWVNADEFDKTHTDKNYTSDQLLVEMRRVIVPINSVPLTKLDIEGDMMVQYYPLAGNGTSDECLATRPYACYSMETNEWFEKPEPITIDHFAEGFLLVEPRARLIAEQAVSLVGTLDIDLADVEYWTSLYERHNKAEYKAQANLARDNANKDWQAVRDLWHQLFKGRQEAYSPRGRGTNDERDFTNKLLEVWGIGDALKEHAYTPLPWAEKDSALHGETTEQKEQSNRTSQKNKTQKGYSQNSEHWTIVADWSEVQDKAVKYLHDGQVQVHLNAPDHIIGTVYSETTDGASYQTEIWRDDPNSNAITLWNCTCPWGEVSWGRTRQWKKFEGRPCAHVTALQWAAKSVPMTEDQMGNEQMQLPGIGPQAPPVPDVTPSQVRQPGVNLQPFAEPPQATTPVPGGPNPGVPTPPPPPPPPPAPPPVMPQPVRPPSHLLQPGENTQLELPGTFSRTAEFQQYNRGDWVRNIWTGDIGRVDSQDEQGYWIDWNDGDYSPVADKDLESLHEGLKPSTPDTFPAEWTSKWYRESITRAVLSWFNNGDAVRAKQPLWGVDRDGKDFIVPKGMAGTVLWSDAEDSIVSFDIEINGPLEPMTIRVEDSTDLFYAAPKANPGFRRRREK